MRSLIWRWGLAIVIGIAWGATVAPSGLMAAPKVVAQTQASAPTAASASR